MGGSVAGVFEDIAALGCNTLSRLPFCQLIIAHRRDFLAHIPQLAFARPQEHLSLIIRSKRPIPMKQRQRIGSMPSDDVGFVQVFEGDVVSRMVDVSSASSVGVVSVRVVVC